MSESMIHQFLQSVWSAGSSQKSHAIASSSRSTRHSGVSSTFFDWVLPNQLAVGRLPRSGEGLVLQHIGIRSVISLCAESEGAWPEDLKQQIRCVRYVLPDSHYSWPLSAPQIAEAVELLHRELSTHAPVFVHCLAGIERSPTLCIAYLCRYQHLSLWEAHNWVKQAHAESVPTDAQLQAIREYLEWPNPVNQVTA